MLKVAPARPQCSLLPVLLQFPMRSLFASSVTSRPAAPMSSWQPRRFTWCLARERRARGTWDESWAASSTESPVRPSPVAPGTERSLTVVPLRLADASLPVSSSAPASYQGLLASPPFSASVKSSPPVRYGAAPRLQAALPRAALRTLRRSRHAGPFRSPNVNCCSHHRYHHKCKTYQAIRLARAREHEPSAHRDVAEWQR